MFIRMIRIACICFFLSWLGYLRLFDYLEEQVSSRPLIMTREQDITALAQFWFDF